MWPAQSQRCHSKQSQRSLSCPSSQWKQRRPGPSRRTPADVSGSEPAAATRGQHPSQPGTNHQDDSRPECSPRSRFGPRADGHGGRRSLEHLRPDAPPADATPQPTRPPEPPAAGIPSVQRSTDRPDGRVAGTPNSGRQPQPAPETAGANLSRHPKQRAPAAGARSCGPGAVGEKEFGCLGRSRRHC